MHQSNLIKTLKLLIEVHVTGKPLEELRNVIAIPIYKLGERNHPRNY